MPELHEMFASLDLDGSGKLSLKEMQKMLKSLADSATGNTDGTKRLAKEVRLPSAPPSSPRTS